MLHFPSCWRSVAERLRECQKRFFVKRFYYRCDQLRAYIAENLAKPLSVASLAARVNLSRNYFLVAFKASLGVTPHRYINQQRTAKAAELLARTDFSMAEIAISVGFADQSHLTRNFSRLLGKTPSAYRRAHR